MRVTHIKPIISACSICQKQEELRPYGKGGALVCFDCAMKDEDEAKRQFSKVLQGSDVLIIDEPIKEEER